MKKLLVLIVSFFVGVNTFAAALPSYSPKFGQAMAGVVQQKVVQRGFAANDPRYIATLSAAGTVVTGLVTAGAVAAGAPLWATLALGAVAAGAIALGADALTKWLFNQDGTVTASSTSTGTGSGGSGGTGTSVQYYESGLVRAGSAMSAMLGEAARQGYPTSGWSVHSSCGSICVQYYGGSGRYLQAYGPYTTSNAATVSCLNDGKILSGGSCIAAPSSTPTPKTMVSAVADLPDSDMTKPVNPQIVADAVNKWWQQAAAQPGYQGLPYSQSDPVTVQDVQAYQQANPGTYPTVSDFVAPAINPTSNTVIVATPSTSVDPSTGAVVQPGTNTAPAGTPQVNLGVDPAIGFPGLEATPTAQMILNPLLSLFPDLKSFVVPSHSVECPKPSATMFGKTLVLEGHCSLLETIRPTLYAVMAAVWVMLALFIVLAA